MSTFKTFQNASYDNYDVSEYKSIDCPEEDVIILSDFHISAGRNAIGNYSGTENFFADHTFYQFIDHYIQSENQSIKTLIINGDFIDFVRVVDVPKLDVELEEWRGFLLDIGIDKSIVELKNSITKKELEYGLKTNDYKSAYKVMKCYQGHPAIFMALALWLEKGNQLYFTKGNHDFEFYWKAVRDAIRLSISKEYRKIHPFLTLENILEEQIFQRVFFVDGGIRINGHVHVEHGMRYDKFSQILGKQTLEDIGRPDELNFPFGLFVNRYFINKIESQYPFLDNVKPNQNILPLIFKENFPMALKILFKHIPHLLKFVNKPLWWYMFGPFIVFVVLILGPVFLMLFLMYKNIKIVDFALPTTGIAKQLLPLLKNFGLLLLSYISSKLFAAFQLSEPDSLQKNAAQYLKDNPSLSMVVYGHTHTPEQALLGNQKFYNTGTWIPIIEISSGNVRWDNIYTFLYLKNLGNKQFESSNLLRWNSDAARPEPLLLIDKK